MLIAKETQAKVIEMYTAGCTYKEIAEKLHLPYCSIYRIVCRYNIPIRGRGTNNKTKNIVYDPSRSLEDNMKDNGYTNRGAFVRILRARNIDWKTIERNKMKVNIIALYNLGYFYEDITKELHVSKCTVTKTLREANVDRKRNKILKQKDKQADMDNTILTYLNMGYNAKEIGEIIGRKRKTILEAKHRNGVYVRTQNRYDKNQIFDLLAKGYSPKQVKEITGCSKTQYYVYRKKFQKIEKNKK